MDSHPAAEIFPPMTGAEYEKLVKDIREHGQREAIVVYDGMILDGRHRWQACEHIGLVPQTVEWDGKGIPETFVISMNLHRRHLSESQRAMIAKKLATLSRGQKKDRLAAPPQVLDDTWEKQTDASIEASTQDEAAKLLKVSRSSVQRAAIVQEKAAPELAQAVERGEIPVSTAAQIVHLPQARQRQIAVAGKKAAAKAAKRVRKQAKRAPDTGLDDPPPSILDDPDFQAVANEAADEIEVDRAERIAMAGTEELVEMLRRADQVNAKLMRRINALNSELGSATYRAKLFEQRAKEWERRAREMGWMDA